MSKFNQSVDIEEKNVADQIREDLRRHPDATVNHEGALSFKLDPLTKLYLMAASTLVGEPKFYTNAKESDKGLLKAVDDVLKIDPEFVLQLAVYCREQLHLRSVPIMLIAEFANSNVVGNLSKAEIIKSELESLKALQKGSSYSDENEKDIEEDIERLQAELGSLKYVTNARKYVQRCIQRADELTELIAYQLARNKVVPRQSTKLPMLLRFGISIAFPKFDGYQLAKYDNKKKAIRMRDSMFLSHPKPREGEQAVVFKKLADKVLEPPMTWEVMRSTGQMTWHDVIHKVFYKNGRVNNYMAILRNLRNCLQDKSVDTADIALLCKMISDKDAVLYSKQLPFRFFAAYRELYKAAGSDCTRSGMLFVPDVLDAIEAAVSYSVENFPKLNGSSTLIACDVSGSMEKEISKNSSIERFDIGIMLGMMANRFAGQTITGMFGDTWKVVPMSRNSGILKNTMEMHSREGEVGYSTNGFKVIEYLLDNDIKVDRIMIFTDAQMWNSRARRSIWGSDMDDNSTFAEKFLRYQKRYPEVKLYCFDLSGYGNIMVPQDTRGVCIIGGWSDRIFDFISVFEEIGEGNTAIKRIKAVKP